MRRAIICRAGLHPPRCSECAHAPPRDPMTMAKWVCPIYVPWLRETCVGILDKAIEEAHRA